MSGLPVDVLFRLGVQSVNGLSNAVALTRQTSAAGSPEFFQLLQDLRRLQIAGLLSVRVEHKAVRADIRSNSDPSRVYFLVATTRDPNLRTVVDEAKRLLGLAPTVSQAEVVYGLNPQPGKVAILSRPILGVLAQLSLQIDVPPDDIARNLTLPTVANIGPEHRPVVIIHSGTTAPDDVFTSAQYHGSWFRIAEDDFDSKLAFTVLQILLALARTEIPPVPAH
jgi:hypothetical protein